MSNGVEESKIFDLRAQQVGYYAEQARDMLCGIPRGSVSPRRRQWFEQVANARVYTYFKILLIQASLRSYETCTDGSRYYYSFSHAGYELACHVQEYVEPDAWDELSAIVDSIEELEDFSDRVKAWLDYNLNHCFKLIPTWRRQIFMRGFIERLREASDK
jgi:hypothetical protein